MNGVTSPGFSVNAQTNATIDTTMPTHQARPLPSVQTGTPRAAYRAHPLRNTLSGMRRELRGFDNIFDEKKHKRCRDCGGDAIENENDQQSFEESIMQRLQHRAQCTLTCRLGSHNRARRKLDRQATISSTSGTKMVANSAKP